MKWFSIVFCFLCIFATMYAAGVLALMATFATDSGPNKTASIVFETARFITLLPITMLLYVIFKKQNSKTPFAIACILAGLVPLAYGAFWVAAHFVY